ncbi:MAG: hypothetical protein ACI8X3_001473, partial [Saprospiraceae bacterium]
MAKKKIEEQVLRPHAELAYAAELKKLQKIDDRQRPTNWNLSP